MEEDEGMTFWSILSYPDIFKFLMFSPPVSGCQIEKLLNRKRKKIYISVQNILARDKKKGPLASFDPLKNCDLKPLSMKDFAEAISKVFPQSILHTAVPKAKVNFFREFISTKIVHPKIVLSIPVVINTSKNKSDFKGNVFTKDNIETI